MSKGWGRLKKNVIRRRDPKWHSDEYEIKEEKEKDFGSNQENIEKLKKSKVLKEGRFDGPPGKGSGPLNTGSRTSYTDEETMAGVDDGRDDSLAETLSNAIMDGWEDTLTTVIKEHLSEEEAKFLDDRGVWINLGSYDEEMLELAMKIRDDLLDTFDREEDSDYEFNRGFEQ